jgi:hypothetical protein
MHAAHRRHAAGQQQQPVHDSSSVRGSKAGVSPGRQQRRGRRSLSQFASSAECSRADHCETSEAAVRDISRVLRVLAPLLLGDPAAPSAQLRLWDPFYCQGTVKVHFRQHGFPLCHNKREDFYALVENSRRQQEEGGRPTLPPHHVLVTNPPFSGTHIQRALEFCAGHGDVPWAMLLPCSVLGQPWWGALSERLKRGGAAAAPMFVAPTRTRYTFAKRRPSGGGGGAQRSTGKAVDQQQQQPPPPPPPPTIWFVGGLKPQWAAEVQARWASACSAALERGRERGAHGDHQHHHQQQQQQQEEEQEECVLVTATTQLPRCVLPPPTGASPPPHHREPGRPDPAAAAAAAAATSRGDVASSQSAQSQRRRCGAGGADGGADGERHGRHRHRTTQPRKRYRPADAGS